MVAIVSGNSLGLDQSSLAALATNGVIGNATQGRNGEGAYVDVSSGNLVLQDADSFLAGVGQNVASLRTYNSQGLANFSNNDGWLNGQNKSLVSVGSGVLQRTDGDGSTTTYLWNATQQIFIEAAAAGSALSTVKSNTNGTYTWTNGSTGNTETYQGTGAGLIQSSVDANGNSLTYTYTGSLLTKVTDADGESVNYTYSGSNLIGVSTTLASSQVLSQVSYTYDGSNRLATVSINLAPAGALPSGSESSSTYVTTYTYDGTSDRVAGVSQSDGTSLSFGYVLANGTWKVASMTDGDGNVTTLAYNTTANTTTVTDPMGVSSVYGYDAGGRLIQVSTGVTAANVSGLSQMGYAYNSLGDVTAMTDGRGRTVAMTYDANGNLTSRVDNAGDTRTYTYNAANQVLTDTTYATPATGSGGSAVAAGTPETTRYVYAAANPTQLRFLISPEGDVTEYRYGSHGLLATTLRYPVAAYPTGALAQVSVPSEAALQTWITAQTSSKIQRQDFAYDVRGQLQSSTTYSSTDALGNGVAGTTTLYAYDQRGELLQTVSPDGTGITQAIYDGLGRVVSTTAKSSDGTLAVTTLTQYDDAHGKTIVTQANGLSTTSTYDGAGRLVSVTPFDSGSADLGTTSYAYDADGRLLMTTDPTGVHTWLLYDASGRKVADVDGSGALTEYVYDQANEVTETIAYATAVNTSALVDSGGKPVPTTLAALRPASSSSDERSWSFYDAAGRLAWQVDAQGYVTVTHYDGASQILSTSRLATAIDTSALGTGAGLTVSGDGISLVSDASWTGLSASMTTLLVSQASSVKGTPVVLVATVAGQQPPSGTITFYDGATALGTATLANGIATLSVSTLAGGTHSLTATYSGDTANRPSSSAAVPENVLTTSTVSLAASSAAIGLGSTVNLTATVTGASPSGMVSFFNGQALLGSAAVVNGQATFLASGLPLGSNSLQAIYSGDAVNAAATSSVYAETVGAASSSTSLTVARVRSSYGGQRLLTAAVTSSAPAPSPTGTVTFYNGATAIGSATLVNGLANLSVSTLPVGSDVLKAVYAGTATNATSTSSVATETVTTVPTTAAVRASMSANGATLTIVATVAVSTAGSPVPTGTVTFTNAGKTIGTATLANGQASLSIAKPSGSLALAAAYGGDALHAASTAPVDATVATTTTIGVSSTSIVQGGPVTLSAQVAGLNASGTVTFLSGSIAIGTATVSNGAASVVVSNLPVGSDTLSATYSGDALNATSVSQQTQVVKVSAAPIVAPSIVLSSSATAAATGAAVILTAQVTGKGIGASSPPTGSVNFYSASTLIGTATLSDGWGAITVSTLAAGADSITVQYSGDAANAAATSAPLVETITAAPTVTTTSLSSSGASVIQGASFTLTANVSGTTPSGVVTFFNGSTALGTATVASGKATLTTALYVVGTDALRATYSGDSSNATSVSGNVSVVVTSTATPPSPPAPPPATTTTLSTSAATAGRGTAVTLKASISGGTSGFVPGGTVSFFDGSTLLGSAVVSAGQASFVAGNLALGSHALTAVYSGDVKSRTSASSPLTETIVLATSVVTLAPPSSLPLGTGSVSATLVAQVNGDAPSGSISFYNGSTLLGSASISNGLAKLTSTLGTGTASLSARYVGDANNAAGTSATTSYTPLVPSAISLTTSTTSATLGAAVTLHAAITGGASTPSGTVSFFNGSTLLGSAMLSASQASLVLTSLPLGADSITAVYSGDGAYLSAASAAKAVTVQPATTSTALTTSRSTTTAGAPLTLTAVITSSASGVTPGGTVTFYNAGTAIGTVNVANGQASFTVSNLPLGTAPITAVYSGDTNNATSSSAAVNETVQATPVTTTVSLAVSAAQSVYGQPLTLTASVSGSGSPSGIVTFYNGTTVLGTATLAGGVASLGLTNLPVGTDALKAVYAGDVSNATSTSAVVSEKITGSVTTLSVLSASSITRNGVLSVRVAGNAPTGQVTFFNGASVLGTATVSNGVATLSGAPLPVGSKTLSATYSGDALNVTSVISFTQTVTPATTATTLTATANSVANAPVVLTASVAGSAPSGTVTFYLGSTALGTATLSDGVGALTTTSLPVGSIAVTAVYSGDGNNLGSTSSAVSKVVIAPFTVSTAASATDRTTTEIYNLDGLLRASIDGEGYLTQYTYDASDQLVQTLAYANAVPGFTTAASIAAQVATARSSDSLAGLLPNASSSDITSFNVYNGRGQLVGQVDGGGYLTETVYDSNGRVSQVVRYASPAVGPITTGSTLAQLRPASSAQDQTSKSTWDALGRLATQTNAEGTVTSYAYNSVGQVVQTTVALNTSDQRTVMARYDVQGRLVEELSGDGAALITGNQTQAAIDAIWSQYATQYTYDAAGRRTSSTDANGNATLFFYDTAGRLTDTVNALGEVSETRYNALGLATDHVDYGTRIDLSGLTGASAGGLVNGSFTAALAAAANASVDEDTRYTYDARGSLASATDPLKNATTYAYDAFGDTVAETSTGDDGKPIVDTAAFDRRGLQTASVQDSTALKVATSATYDAFGRVIQTTDGNGNVRRESYDTLGRVVQSIDPTNATRSTTYDAFSRVLTQTDALNQTTTYTYDPASRSVTVTTPDGVSVKSVHNREGQTLAVTDGLGNTTSYVYDDDGNLIETDAPPAAGSLIATTTKSTFDAADRLITTTDANNNLVSYSYDAANRILTRTVDPSGFNIVTTYGYDALGRQVSVTDANGNTTTTDFDLDNNVLTIHRPGGWPTIPTNYTYDAKGRVLTSETMGLVTAYAYDALGRLVKLIKDPGNRAYGSLDIEQDYTYDKNGNLISSTDGDGNLTRYVYDADDRLTYTIDALGDTSRTLYDADGRVTSTTTFITPIPAALLASLPVPATVAAIGPLLTASTSDVTEFRRYDSDGRLSFTVAGDGSVVQYSYDANGNVIATRAYANKLSSSFMASWNGGSDPTPVADVAHDQQVRTVYDALNRAIYTIDGTGGVTAMSYDGNGNVVDKIAYATTISPTTAATAAAIGQAIQALAPDAANAEVRSYYDTANRLSYSVDGMGAVTQYTYDGMNHVTREVQYATLIAVGSSPIAIASSEADRVTEWVYDLSGRVAFKLQRVSTTGATVGMSTVTSYLYDTIGNLARVRETAALIPDTMSRDYESLCANVPVDAATDPTTYYGYDEANRLDITIGPDGLATLYKYDAASNLISTTQEAHRVDTSTFDQDPGYRFNSLHPTYTWTFGSSLQYYYTSPSGNDRTTVYAYDNAGRKVYSIDALGYATGTSYDGAGRVVSTTLYANAAGNVFSGVTPSQIKLTPDASRDQSTSFTYDAEGRLLSSTDALGGTESYTYDGVGNQVSFTNKLGNTWTYDHDADGRTTLESAPVTAFADGSNTLHSIATRLTYDALGNLTSRTEASNTSQARTTQYVYDALGRLTKTIYPPVGVYNPTGDDLNASLSAVSGASALRSEQTKALSTQVIYDAFGDAIANVDTAGNISTKAYDGTGRVLYDVDALGYVTGYQYDAFGDQAVVTRYANATSVNPTANPSIGNIPNAGTIAAAIVSSSADRTTYTQYDQMGRVVQVTQPSVWVDNGNGQGSQASAVTETSYDTFGQVIQVSTLADVASNAWATSTYYYDLRGDQVASVDALGYLTTQSFDAAGNVLSATQYANAASAVSIYGYTAPAASASDRTTTYTYDEDNRKTSETQVGVGYSTASDGSATTGNLTTTYGYDALGNLTRTTDALGNSTTVYYDSLSRVLAVVAPARNSTVDGTSLSPVTTFTYDVFGNETSEAEFSPASFAVDSAGDITVGWTGNTPGTERVTATSYDGLDRAVESDEYDVDASGTHLSTEVQRFMSYDAQGRLAKSWQGVSGNDGLAHTLYTVYQYDALGRQTAIITPASDSVLSGPAIGAESQEAAGSITTGMVWDAFGDMTKRGTYATGSAAQYQETFAYDNAGNLWRTNSGDGNVEIAIYDLQGEQTVQITSAGSLDLGTMANAQQADQLGNNGVRRTDSGRDLLGRVTQQTLPSRQDSSDAQAYRPVVYQTFDRWGNVVSRSDPRNSAWVTQYAYNADNEVIQETQPDSSGGITAGSPVSRMYYDALGREVATRDADGNVDGQTWDGAGQLATEIHADGGVITHSYDGFGNQVRLIDADGNETDYGYDFLGRNTSVTQVGVGVYSVSGTGAITGGLRSITTSYSYDQAGRLLSQASDSGGVEKYAYDLRGDLIETDNADGLVSRSTFDAEGHQTAEQDGDGNLRTWQYYDIFGLLKSSTAIGGAQEQFFYDNARELVSQTDAMGATTTYGYDAAGQRVSQVIDPSGLNLQQGNSYDAAGNLITTTDGDGNVTRYVYDTDGRLTYTIDGAGDATRTSYDAAGRISSTTTFATPIAASALAALPAATTSAAVALLLTPSTSDVTEIRRYDAEGRLRYTVAGDGSVVEYSYDENGNVVDKRAYAAKLSASFMAAWDGKSDPSPVADEAQDQRMQTVYDALNRAIYTLDGTGAVTAMAYDGNGNLVDKIAYDTTIDPNTAATAAAIVPAVQAAQALEATHSNQEVRSIYDAAGRLTMSVDGTGAVTGYSYDGAGNMTRKVAYATAIAAGTDPRTVTASAADHVTEWVYDGSERVAFQLQRVTTSGASVGQSEVTSYLYDSDGRLARTRVASITVADTQSRSYTSLLAAVVPTVGGANPSTDRTTYFGYDKAGRLSIQIAADGAATLYAYDGAGHLTATTEQATRVNTSSFDTSSLFTTVKPSYTWATGSVLLGLTNTSSSDRTTIYAYDGAGRKSFSIDALGYATQTTYDGAGRILNTTLYANAAGNVHVGVTPSQIQVTSIPGVDHTNTFAYDPAGHLLSSTDAVGESESYTYDGVGNQLTFTNKKGVTWFYQYDAAGRVTLETDPAADSSSVAVTTQLGYDALGNLISRTEAANTLQARTTTYAYDALGRQVRITYPPVSVYAAATDPINGASGLEASTPYVTTPQTFSTQVVYDAFGDAVANVDAAGNISIKAYDGMGRVVYDVDAMGYVTGYGLDTFGDVTTLTRYASATTLLSAVTPSGGNAPNASTIASAIALSSGNSRSIQTVYDAMGRAVQVTQPSVWVDTGNGSGYSAAAVTKTSYNAFGQVLQSSVLADLPSNSWATETYYYNVRGDQVACIDALGFLTTQAFDAAGNLTATTEYANAASGVTTTGYTVPTSSASDRTMRYAYDQNNRKTSQTQVGVVYSNVPDGSTTTGNVTTSYGYDVLGNLTRTTDALGNSTYTYYDNLGRISAVAAPARTSTVDGTTLIPLTIFMRDAFGNVIEQVEYGAGASVVNATGYRLAAQTPGSWNNSQRVTFTKYDSHGNAIEVDDADGVQHFMSYDALGRLVKSWQQVSSGSAVLYTEFQYDALGRQTAIITPSSNSILTGSVITTEGQQSAGSTVTSMAWDAFGEMTQRGTYQAGATPIYQESFEYDNAGRLWRTNSGDGNVKIALYNLQGQQTGQLTSAGSVGGTGANLSLSTIANAQAADQLGSAGISRTDSQRDLLGRVTQETLPSRLNSSGSASFRPVVYQGYDRWGNMTSQSDVRNAAWVAQYTYNANNQVIQQVQPDAGDGIGTPTTRIFYDALGRQVATIDADGNLNGQTWDAAGQLATEIHADHDAKGGIVTHSYDAYGDQIRLIDADDDETDYGYDNMGRNTSVTNVDVPVYQYQNFGVPTVALIGKDDNLTTVYSYDWAGRKIAEEDGLDGGQNTGTTTYSYDLRGNVIETDGPDGLVSKATFDAEGHQTAEQDADGHISTWQYGDIFGQLKSHTDIGGDVYQYTYDNARLLLSQVQTVNPSQPSKLQSLAYKYDAAGQLVYIKDNTLNEVTTYTYTAAGQHVLEQTVQGTTTVQSQTLTYDNLDRLKTVQALGGVSLVMSYDKVGNKLHEQATYGTGSNAKTQQLWFAYDAMNRQTLADGAADSNNKDLANITSTQGHILTYDYNGNRTSDTSYGVQVAPQYTQNYDESSGGLDAPVFSGYDVSSGVETQWYTYDHMNRLQSVATGAFSNVEVGTNDAGNPIYQDIELPEADAIPLDVREYDGSSRVLRSGPTTSLDPNYVAALVADNLDLSGATTTITQYDPAGRVLTQQVINLANSSNSYNISYQTPTGTVGSGYDSAGNVKAYRMTQGQVTTDYTINLQLGESYLQSTIAAKSTNKSSGNTTTGTTTDTYDANGYLTGVSDSAQSANSRTFINDASGHVLQKNQWGHALNEIIVNGAVIGSVGSGVDPDNPTFDGNPNYVPIADFDLGYEAVTNSYPAATTGQYPVQSGDTLQSIAQAAYGDSSLWYEIADANGLSGNQDLRVGQIINIPAKVGDAHNNSSTYATYDASKIVGNTSPQLPTPAGNSGGCGALGELLVTIVAVVVAVAVTVISENPDAGALTFDEFMDAAETAAETATPLQAAEGAVAGNLAGQFVGNLIGTQDGFSFKSVALAAISAGVSQGVGLTGFAPTSNGIANAAINAALSNAASQGIEVAVGLQHHFSWTQVAASAAGAAVGQQVKDAIGGSFGTSGVGLFAKHAVSAFAGGLTTSILGGGHTNVVQIATDAFGNALGGSLAEAALPSSPDQSAAETARLNGYDAAAAQANTQAQLESFRASEIGQQNDEAVQQVNAGLYIDTRPPTTTPASTDLSNQLVGIFGAANPAPLGTSGDVLLASADSTPTGLGAPPQEMWLPMQVFHGNGTTEWVYGQGTGGTGTSTAPVTYSPGSPNDVGGLETLDSQAAAQGGTKYLGADGNLYDTPQPPVMVIGHRMPADEAAQSASPGDSISAITPTQGFFIFNPVGRFLSGVGNGAKNLALGVVELGKQTILTSGDVIGTGLYGLNNALGGRHVNYPLDSTLGRSLQTQGFGPTALNFVGNLAQGLVAPITAPLGSLYRQDAMAFGESLPIVATAALPVLRGGAAVEATAVNAIDATTAAQLGSRASSVSEVGNAGAPAVGATGTVAPKMSIGASGYASYDEVAQATYKTYQTAVDEGYATAQEALQNGSLKVPPGSSQQMVLGQETDAFARDTMKLWAQGEGLPEGAGAPSIIQINRRLLDPSFSGAYRVPDVFVPPAGQIFDASLEFKTWNSPQIQDFWNYSGGSRITIVRPTEVGGSYSLLPPW